MPIPRLLIVSPNPPGDGSVNEILLRDLALLYPSVLISCFAVVNPGVTMASTWTPSELLATMPVEMHRWVHKLTYRRLPAVAVPAARMAAGVGTWMRQLPALRARAISFAREQRAEAVWGILNSPVLYPLAVDVADALEVPLYSSVWDPPERMAEEFKLDPISRRVALHHFDRAIGRSTRVSVISEGMRDAFETKYGIEPVILRHGLRSDICRPPASAPHDPNRLTIGFAGSIYTPDQFRALTSALDSLNWRVGERDLLMILYGAHGHESVADHPRIERRGWLPVERVVEELASTDVVYLPYRFDEAHAISVRTAFPTKLSTYLATGRPILYHGPFDSTPRRFFDRYPAAVCCHSMSESDLIDALGRFDDVEAYGAMTRAGARALREELGHETTRRRLAELFGVDVAALNQ